MKRVVSLQDTKMDDEHNPCYFKFESGCFVDNPKYFVDESEYNKCKRVGDIIKISVNDCLREFSIKDITSLPNGNANITMSLKACD